MAITNKQLEEVGFVEDNQGKLSLYLSEEDIIYATFWKNGTKLYVDTLDNPKEREFIYLEHLSMKALDLFITRTASRLRKWKSNQEHIKALLDGSSKK